VTGCLRKQDDRVSAPLRDQTTLTHARAGTESTCQFANYPEWGIAAAEKLGVLSRGAELLS
jgi:hypothetical protein